MAKEKLNEPQSQEELIKAAQDATIKAAIEQAQSMFGNIPGFQMPDTDDMQAQIMAQMKAAVPDLEEIQAQQAAMGTLGDIDPEEMAQACRQNMAYAGQVMQEIEDGTLAGKLQDTDTALGRLMEDFDADWEINRAGNGELNAEQLRLLAFGAPLLVYNDEYVDAIDSEIDTNIIRTQLKNWWEVTDRESTFEIVEWLLNEGHHAGADNALAVLREHGSGNIPEEEYDNEESKMEDVCLIVKDMLENGYCTEKNIPQTAIAWDLVRVVNVGRWAYLCGYIAEGEMWEIMQQAVEVAKRYFSSWAEYGRSFVLGRGVWHGEPDDSETAYEIVSVLLENEESPWKQLAWDK
ncbi:MAG: DUF1266 domain-containing protein [Parabacteroides sp.]|nr:DUF1266 domain-containing protein [Parabacteroides sp.]